MLWLLCILACEREKVNPIYPDADSDGFTSENDCDDDNASVYPDAPEICDGVDNDCDALIDDEDDSFNGDSFYRDTDSDGFGQEEVLACSAPEGTVEIDGDCDDSDAAIHPNASEICDGVDNDCDGAIDDDDDSLEAPLYYLDGDGDAFGSDTSGEPFCEQPDGRIVAGGDCDDSDATIHPNASEVCDGVDNDCNALVDMDDDGLDVSEAPLWYADNDQDQEGDPSSVMQDCVAPTGYVSNNSDCNDAISDLNSSDIDGDGLSSCDGDCDDSDAAIQSCESCIEENLFSAMGSAVFNGSLDGTSTFSGSCTSTSEVIFRWKAPASDTYFFRFTSEFEPVFSVLDDCSTEQSCMVGYEHMVSLAADEVLTFAVGGDEGDFSLSVGTASEDACDDGNDNDADGLVDCDDEEDCWYDEACSFSSCPNFDLIDTATYEPATGLVLSGATMALASDDQSGSCISDNGVDYSFYWESPVTGCAQVMAYSDDMDLGLYSREECGGEELTCNDDDATTASQFSATYASYIAQDIVAGGVYIFGLESESSTTGSYSLHIELSDIVYCDGTLVQ